MVSSWSRENFLSLGHKTMASRSITNKQLCNLRYLSEDALETSTSDKYVCGACRPLTTNFSNMFPLKHGMAPIKVWISSNSKCFSFPKNALGNIQRHPAQQFDKLTFSNPFISPRNTKLIWPEPMAIQCLSAPFHINSRKQVFSEVTVSSRNTKSCHRDTIVNLHSDWLWLIFTRWSSRR